MLIDFLLGLMLVEILYGVFKLALLDTSTIFLLTFSVRSLTDISTIYF